MRPGFALRPLAAGLYGLAMAGALSFSIASYFGSVPAVSVRELGERAMNSSGVAVTESICPRFPAAIVIISGCRNLLGFEREISGIAERAGLRPAGPRSLRLRPAWLYRLTLASLC